MWFCAWLAVTVLAGGATCAPPNEDSIAAAPASRVRRQWGMGRNGGYGRGRYPIDDNSNFDDDFDLDGDGDRDSFGGGDDFWPQRGPGQGDFSFPHPDPSFGFHPDSWNVPPPRPGRPKPNQGGMRNPQFSSGPRTKPDASRQSAAQNTRPAVTARPGAGGVSTQKCGVTIEVPRIINGKEAQRGEYPWQVALIYEKGQERRAFCGGALVHPRWVLTAAHCLDPNTIRGYTLVELRLGLIDQKRVDDQARAFVPDRRITHPQYRGGTAQGVRNQNDIALLRLPQAAPYTEFIRPVCLPALQRSGANAQKSTLVVAGWGITQDGTFSDQLMFASVAPVDARTCSARLSVAIAESQVCAGGSTTDSCNGDSGGPLIQAAPNENGETVFQVIGLVSFGPTNCATPGTPGAYTRVASFRSWIEQVIREQS